MILLFNPQSNPQSKPVLPIALLTLGSVLEGEYDYEIVDGNLCGDTERELTTRIQATGAKILGVTVMGGPQLHNAVPVCRLIKQKFPGLTIVWGGYFPTQHYEICLKASYVDYVVRGHGEYVFRELVEKLQDGGNLGEMQNEGIAYRDPGASLTVTDQVAAIPDPEQLPPLPYHKLPVQEYIRSTYLGSRTLSHHTSYGCPFKCNFCAVVNMVDGKWKPQSAERTAETVQSMQEKWDVNGIEFFDNNFFVHERRTTEFAERINDLNINWWGEARVDTMMKYSDETWQKMKESGLRMLFLGAESGSDETLQRMNKGGKASTRKTLELVRRMKEYNVVPELSFVMGNPPEPKKDIDQTIQFIRKVKRINPAAEIIMYMYTPVPQSGELFEQAKQNGFNFPETLEGWISDEWKEFASRRSRHIPWVDNPMHQKVRNFERVLNAYYPTVTDQRLNGWKKALLKAAGGWRYHTEIYRKPLELRALQKFMHYQRPETSGF